MRRKPPGCTSCPKTWPGRPTRSLSGLGVVSGSQLPSFGVSLAGHHHTPHRAPCGAQRGKPSTAGAEQCFGLSLSLIIAQLIGNNLPLLSGLSRMGFGIWVPSKSTAVCRAGAQACIDPKSGPNGVPSVLELPDQGRFGFASLPTRPQKRAHLLAQPSALFCGQDLVFPPGLPPLL